VTTPSVKADGFLGHARTIVPRFVPKPQSEAQNITGSVDISVNDKPAVRARVNTVSKSFRNIRQASASGAYPRSPVGVNPDKLPTSVFYFIGELGKERTPSRIVDRTSKHTTRQSLDIQILNGNKPVVVGNLPAELMLEVRPLVTNVGVSLLEKTDCLSSVDTTLLPSGDFSLASSQLCKPHLQIAGVSHQLPIGKGDKRIKPNINADSLGLRGRAFNILNNTEAGIPLSSIALQGKRFNLANDRAVHLEFNDTNALNLEPSVFGKVAAIVPVREGETAKPISGLETGVACFLTYLDSAKESLKCFVYSPKHILTGRVVGKFKIAHIPYFFKLVSLVVVVATNPLHLPRLPSFLNRSIVKGAGFRELMFKQSNLLFGRIQTVFISSPHTFLPLDWNALTGSPLGFCFQWPSLVSSSLKTRYNTLVRLSSLSSFLNWSRFILLRIYSILTLKALNVKYLLQKEVGQ